jgi:hypothetical protein
LLKGGPLRVRRCGLRTATRAVDPAADLDLVDLATSAAPTVLDTGVDRFTTTTANDRAVYTKTDDPATRGIYVLALP